MFISLFGHPLLPCIARGLVVLLALPYLASSQTTARSCPIIDGGGGIRVHGLDAIFSATADAQGTTLHTLVLVRAPSAFRSRSLSTEKAQQYLVRGPGGAGGNVGPLRIVYNKATRVVWIDSLPIRLKDDNNLLLIEVGSNDSLAVVGQVRMEPRLPIPPGPCGDDAVLRSYQQAADTLWARFRAIPQVRTFVSDERPT